MSLPAATGALLLFGAVQATMIGYGLWKGERLRAIQMGGLLVAFAGLAGLLLPGVSAPPPWGAALMLYAIASGALASGGGVAMVTVAAQGHNARTTPGRSP